MLQDVGTVTIRSRDARDMRRSRWRWHQGNWLFRHMEYRRYRSRRNRYVT